MADASRFVALLHEAKVADLLAGVAAAPPIRGQRRRWRFAAVLGDLRQLPHIARIHPALSLGDPATQLIRPGRSDGYEDMRSTSRRRLFVLVEAVRPSGRTGPGARICRALRPLASGRSTSRCPPNKGLEGLSCVRRNGRVRLLAMCEGNNCLDGRAGRRPGRRPGARVRRGRRPLACGIDTIRLPASLPFTDYSSVSVRGERIAVVSQESSALWVGWLSSSTWDVADDGATYIVSAHTAGTDPLCQRRRGVLAGRSEAGRRVGPRQARSAESDTSDRPVDPHRCPATDRRHQRHTVTGRLRASGDNCVVGRGHGRL